MSHHKWSLLTALLSLLLPLCGIAQVFTPLLDPVNIHSDYSAGARLEGGVASNSFTNRFIKNLYFSNFLKTQEINAQSGKLRKENRLGGDYAIGLFGTVGFGPAGKLWLGLGDYWHADALVPSSAFDLTFYGNKRFAGDTLSIAPAGYNLLRYQKLSAGWMYGEEGRWAALASASYLKGERFERMDLESGRFFTNARGEEIIASAKGSVVLDDTNRKGFFAFNGHGFGIDLAFQYWLGPSFVKNGRLAIGIEIRNAGMLFWNKKTVQGTVDTLISYSGIHLEDPLQISDSTLTANSPDTVVEEFTALLSRGSHRSTLPGWLHVYAQTEVREGITYGAGAAFRYGHHYKPYFYGNMGYAFNENFQAAAIVGHGGYGRFNAGLRVAYTMDLLQIALNLQHLEAWALPKSQGGGWAGLTLTKGF